MPNNRGHHNCVNCGACCHDHRSRNTSPSFSVKAQEGASVSLPRIYSPVWHVGVCKTQFSFLCSSRRKNVSYQADNALGSDFLYRKCFLPGRMLCCSPWCLNCYHSVLDHPRLGQMFLCSPRILSANTWVTSKIPSRLFCWLHDALWIALRGENGRPPGRGGTFFPVWPDEGHTTQGLSNKHVPVDAENTTAEAKTAAPEC